MAVLIAVVITGTMILGLAGIMLSGKLAPGAESLCLTIVRGLSCLIAGFFIGKKNKKFGFLWGLLIGLIYYGLLLLIRSVTGADAGSPNIRQLITLALCAFSGMLGGMLS